MIKKGQVTLFVVLGLVLALIAALFFFAFRNIATDNPSNQVSTHDFSAVIAGYQASAQTCILADSKRAIKQIMSHGGYIDPAAHGFFAQEFDTTRGNALTLSTSGEELIPFWFEHLARTTCQSNCPVRSNIPHLEKQPTQTSIQEQLEEELSKSIQTCLNNIQISPDYEMTPLEEPAIKAIIGDSTITYILNRDVEFTYVQTNAKTTTDEVTAKQTVHLKALYDIGVSIIDNAEILEREQFMPRATKQVIQSFSMSDSGIPPISGEVEFTTKQPRRWLLHEVKDELINLLADNIPLIEIKGTSKEQLFIDENYYSQALYNSGPFSPDITLPHYDKLDQFSIDFYYNSAWGVDLEIYPRNGVVIQPQGGVFSPVPFFRFGVADYRFRYDLTYPVVVIISDENAFNGEGLSLIYAFETSLKDNNPINYSNSTTLYEEDPLNDLFATDKMRMNGLISIEVIDALTAQRVKDVDLTYVCGDASTTAGTTQAILNEIKSVTSLPQCVGGFITGYHQDYTIEPTALHIVGDEDKNLTVLAKPLKEINFGIRTHLYAKTIINLTTQWQLATQNEGGFLHPLDSAIYQFRRINQVSGQEEYIVSAEFNKTSQNTIKLTPGEYEVQVQLLREYTTQNPFIIPEGEVCYDSQPLNPFGGEECEIIPEIKINSSFYVGGIDSPNIIINDTLYTAQKLDLHIVEVNMDDVDTHDDLGAISVIEDLSQEHNETIGVWLS